MPRRRAAEGKAEDSEKETSEGKNMTGYHARHNGPRAPVTAAVALLSIVAALLLLAFHSQLAS